MEEQLISKKDLLELTGISYGQLYRWKRKNLIPEDWFIRKSTFTGQETFFPKAKILDRIDKIKDMKDDLSLDDMAEMFSPQLAEIFLNKDELLAKGIVSQMGLNIYEGVFGETKVLSFEKILFIYLLETFLQSGEVGIEEGKAILTVLEENYKNFEGKYCDVVVIRKFGVAICFLLSVPNTMYLEKGSKLVGKLNIAKSIEDLKVKL